MAYPGDICELPIELIERNSIWLDNLGEPVEMSPGDLPFGKKEGDLIEVFLYLGKNKEKLATTEMPLISRRKVAFLRVDSVFKNLAFVNIGLERDIVIPPGEQGDGLEEGKRFWLMLKYSAKQDELQLTTNLGDLIHNRKAEMKEGDIVQIAIHSKIDGGAKVIVDERHWGYLPRHEQIFDIRRGERYKAWVTQVKPHEVVLSLQPPGEERMDMATQRILDKLAEHRGYLRLTEKTDSEEIQLRLRMSKRTLREAIEKLVLEGKIKMTSRGMKLLKEE